MGKVDVTPYLTEAEVDALQDSGLHRRSPYVITGVSSSYFSVARHYGGCTYQGDEYLYDPLSDELVRGDVLAWVAKRRAKGKRVKASAEAVAQGELL